MATEFSALTGKFRANLEFSTSGGINKRNRQPLSCAPCRSKKLKCNRGHPCETCIRKGDVESCTYGKAGLVPSKPDFSSTSGANGANNNRGKAQERLRHLEQLVMQIVDKGGRPSQPRPNQSTIRSDATATVSTNASIAREGQFHIETADESRYMGSTHWSAILQNIQELKSALHVSPGSEETHVSVSSSGGGEGGSSQPDDGVEDTTTFDRDPPELEEEEGEEEETLFAAPSGTTLSHIISTCLPRREQVDRRLSTYFNSTYMVIPFIHTWEFQRQYEAFWAADPVDTSPFWLSILFSICCMSATLSEAMGLEPRTPDGQRSARATFLSASRQCLRLGGLTRLKRFSIEAFALYTQCVYIQTLDPSGETALIWAVLVRQAYRAGYHRDSSHFASSFSVFDGEMRRRVWAMLRQFDLMLSFQLGLPNQIPPGSWDTQDPRNLLDADFNVSTTELPPSRPENEATQILYFIVKSRLMTSFGKVTAHALSFRDASQADVMALDREVRAVHATVPDILRIRPMSQSFADPAYLVMVRLNCEFLFQKSLCVLHRKYMTVTDPVTGEDRYPESIAACVDAAVAIARRMLDMHKEFKPGGQLHDARWMLSSFTMNDFYLASIVLCLAVSIWKKRHPGGNIETDDADPRMRDVWVLLRSAFNITVELSPTSREAKRVADVLRVVLDGVGPATNRSNYLDSTLDQNQSRREQPSVSAGSDPATTQKVSGDRCRFLSTDHSRKEPVVGEWPRLHHHQQGRQGRQQDVFVDVHEFNLTPLSLNESVSRQQRQHQQGTKSADDWQLDCNPVTHGFPFQLPFQTPTVSGRTASQGNGSGTGMSGAGGYAAMGTTGDSGGGGVSSSASNGTDTFMTTATAMSTTTDTNADSSADMDTNANADTNPYMNTATTTATATASMNPMNVTLDMDMDIDWAFLDQWMAIGGGAGGDQQQQQQQDWMNSDFRFS
ncbi:hypothetical protein PV08_07329 [Exophiala spinifera]|uniref:Zn(2)-C6 fungal-type domain-containing protein n=1 Tax=Exophiala spinifera TaxID=91928 RepID=A0A0D2B7C1_9EURO|nr:uncharacterized protein PV08_07329 [Exophiala spinifera]KIW14545.1 hypothetical protein PV08_07329 [Exophiala spinifera]